ncbi:MAG: hypothetical protein J3K34DRAFT_404301 [Monoraphidium minutum]|nr:MAG: hypothetical protein J3K34DRAFT_404301 [Monoraphidium minutum]
MCPPGNAAGQVPAMRALEAGGGGGALSDVICSEAGRALQAAIQARYRPPDRHAPGTTRAWYQAPFKPGTNSLAGPQRHPSPVPGRMHAAGATQAWYRPPGTPPAPPKPGTRHYPSVVPPSMHAAGATHSGTVENPTHTRPTPDPTPPDQPRT